MGEEHKTEQSKPAQDGNESALREERYFPVTEWGVRESPGGKVEPHAVLVEAHGREWLVPGHVLGDVHMRREEDGSLNVHAEIKGRWGGEKGTEVRLVGSRTRDETRARHLATLAQDNLARCARMRKRHSKARWQTHRSYGGEMWHLGKRAALGTLIGCTALWLGGGVTGLVAAAALGYAGVQVARAVGATMRWRAEIAHTNARYNPAEAGKGEPSRGRERGREGWERREGYARWTPPAKGTGAATQPGGRSVGLER